MGSVGPNRIQRFTSAAARIVADRIPAFPGKGRFLRLFSTQLVAEVAEGVWIHVDPKIGIEFLFLSPSRRLDDAEISLVDEILLPGMCVLDVGAFVGVMSLVAAKKVGKTGRVVAFEPGPAGVIRFVRNRDLNQANNITIIPAAVGSCNSLIEYNFYPNSPDQSSVGYCQIDELSQSIMVPVVSLDECVAQLGLERVDLIKIDVEGAEPHVLLGAQSLLGNPHSPLLVMEVNAGALKWAGHTVSELVAATIRLGYEVVVLEVARSRAYVNVIGLKPNHRERFPGLMSRNLIPILDHEWYREHQTL